MSAQSRLRWRCRRGTQELDLLLGWWLDARFSHAHAVQKAAFEAMLEAQDPDLWDWLTGHGQPADPRFAVIVDEIRAHHRL